jgi:hypothetical protein
VFKIKMERSPSHRQMISLIDSKHVSAQMGLNQMILEEYTNDHEIRIIPRESPDDGVSAPN